MLIDFKDNIIGYFNFYRSLIGKSIYIYIFINILVGLLDGIGLAMFIPLISLLSQTEKQTSTIEAPEKLIALLQSSGLSLNLSSILSAIIVIFILKGLAHFLQIFYLSKIRYQFIKNLRYHLLDILDDLGYKGFLTLDYGKIQNNLTNEISKLFGSMTNYFIIIQSASMLVVYLILALFANMAFATFIIIGGILLSYLYKKILRKIKAASIKSSQTSSVFNSLLIQAVHNFKYLKATNRFTLYSKKLKSIINDAEILNFNIGKYQALIEGIKEPIAIIFICIIIYVQLKLVHGNINSILITLLLLYRCSTQFNLTQSNLHSFNEGIGSIETIKNTIKEISINREKLTGEINLNLIESIQIKDVNVVLNNSRILKNINLDIPINNTIAIIGPSGAGKTTLANIISGLITPNEGCILINNNLLDNYQIKSYRNKIGYITQDPVIFNDSLYNNITFFDSQNEENLLKFKKAANQAYLTSFIENLPEKEKTILGDNGMLISGGQRQRISIARELYNHKEIIIFDEATSSLDTITERIIQSNIIDLKLNSTIIIIAHRLSTIKNADIIYMMIDGEIQESGTYNSLMHNSITFRELIKNQNILTQD